MRMVNVCKITRTLMDIREEKKKKKKLHIHFIKLLSLYLGKLYLF